MQFYDPRGSWNAAWTVRTKPVPRQLGETDCGVFVCCWMKLLANNMEPCYDHVFMKYFRHYLIRELIVLAG